MKITEVHLESRHQSINIILLIHPESCECTKTELDLFSVPNTLTGILQSKWVEYLPLTYVSENSNSICFVVGGSGEEYIDLSEMFLHVVAKITNPDPTRKCNLQIDSHFVSVSM